MTDKVREASQFEQVMNRLENIEQRLEQLIHDLGPRIDQDEFVRGVTEDLFSEPEQPYSQEQVEAYIDESEGFGPRTRVSYKTNQGGEAFIDWNSLDPDMQTVVEIARTREGEWQLYEDPSGSMRIMVDPEVEQEFRRRKLGNATS